MKLKDRILTPKRKQSILDKVFSGTGFIVLMILLEVLLVLVFYRIILNNFLKIVGVTFVIQTINSLIIISRNDNPSFKLSWVLIVYILPLLGSFIYFYSIYDPLNLVFRKNITKVLHDSTDYIESDIDIENDVKNTEPELYHLHNYLKHNGNNGIYTNTKTIYFPSGEEQFKDILVKLKEAQKFIFLEYFIIDEGKMWGEILKILLDKVQQGVDVRVIYDGTCDIKRLPRSYSNQLNKLGIKCVKFAPIYPFISTYYNFRDHRKILVIDGKYGYVGGTNLADEYINEISPFGYWKDTCLLLEGSAIKSLTLMFLQMFSQGKKITEYSFVDETIEIVDTDGYVIPYCDSPLDDCFVGKNVYLDMINSAKKSILIMTPYYVVDLSISQALEVAAQKGVKVSLILPGIPDKVLVNALAKRQYQSLIDAGIEIYEFTKGFIHAKQVCCDNEKAVVGSINFDYRSFYHNFECAIYLYKTSSVNAIEEDMQDCLKECHKIEQSDIDKQNLMLKIRAFIAKIFEPLM